MAAVEIDETELANFRQVAQTVRGMMGNPKARKFLLQAQKAVDPSAVIPELDAMEPVMEELKKLREDMASLKTETASEKEAREKAERNAQFQNKWNEGRNKLKSEGYTDEGITAIEKLMEERGIIDHEIAASYYDRMNPPPTPVASSSNTLPFPIFDPAAKQDGNPLKALMDGQDEAFLQAVLPQAKADVWGKGR